MFRFHQRYDVEDEGYFPIWHSLLEELVYSKRRLVFEEHVEHIEDA